MKKLGLFVLLFAAGCDNSYPGGYRVSAESCLHGAGAMTWGEAKAWNARCEYDTYGTIDGKPISESEADRIFGPQNSRLNARLEERREQDRNRAIANSGNGGFFFLRFP